MKLLIVNNLSSGFRDGAIYDFVRAFARDGDEICMRCTNGCTDLADFLRDAEDFDAVVAAGGDGTVATAAHLLAETGIPLLPFPAGTANLLAMNLASPAEPHALAKLMRESLLMDFDIGEIELANGEHFGFTMIAGAGYDATIMQGAESTKKLLGPMAYFTSAFVNPLPQFSKITLDIDGEHVETQGPAAWRCTAAARSPYMPIRRWPCSMTARSRTPPPPSPPACCPRQPASS